jgi:hypothetical protein
LGIAFLIVIAKERHKRGGVFWACWQMKKMPFIGYHMPWPGLGYVETRGDGFRYVPASYQMML